MDMHLFGKVARPEDVEAGTCVLMTSDSEASIGMVLQPFKGAANRYIAEIRPVRQEGSGLIDQAYVSDVLALNGAVIAPDLKTLSNVSPGSNYSVLKQAGDNYYVRVRGDRPGSYLDINLRDGSTDQPAPDASTVYYLSWRILVKGLGDEYIELCPST